jgi:hypothetical protein
LYLLFIETKTKKKKREFQEEEEGVQIFRMCPPLANCPFDIGIKLPTSSCPNSSSSPSL